MPSSAAPQDATRAIVGSAAFVGLGLWAGVWWFWVPALVVLGLCLVAAIPDGRGPAVPPSELREIEERLQSIERAQYSD